MKHVTLALWICIILSGPAMADNSTVAANNGTTDNATTAHASNASADNATTPLEGQIDASSNATNATPDHNATNDLPAWIFPLSPPYVSKGKIDPFVWFIKPAEVPTAKSIVAEKKERKPLTPLESVEVNQLKLVGILHQPNGALAMVEMPDGKGFLIRAGMRIGLYDGVVTAIENERLVVEEEYVDVFGEAKKRTAYLRLRQEKE